MFYLIIRRNILLSSLSINIIIKFYIYYKDIIYLYIIKSFTFIVNNIPLIILKINSISLNNLKYTLNLYNIRYNK